MLRFTAEGSGGDEDCGVSGDFEFSSVRGDSSSSSTGNSDLALVAVN